MLVGCAQFAPQAPGVPTADNLVQFQAELAKLSTMERTELVKLGFSYADQQCNQFFYRALGRARQKFI